MCVCSGYFGLISADVPYGDQKDHGVDPPWSDTELATVVEGIWHMAAPKCTVVIQVGGVDLSVQWRKALKSKGFTIETEPRSVCPSRADSSGKYHANPGRSRRVVSTSHLWVVALKGRKSLFEVKGAAPFGVFDKWSHVNATTLMGCPVTRPADRLLNADGDYVRTFEKHVT